MSIDLIKKYNSIKTCDLKYDNEELYLITDYLLNSDFNITINFWGFDYLNKKELVYFLRYNNELINSFVSHIENNNYRDENLIFFINAFSNDPYGALYNNSKEEQYKINNIVKFCLNKMSLDFISMLLSKIDSRDLSLEYFILNKFKNDFDFKNKEIKYKEAFGKDLFLISNDLIGLYIFKEDWVDNAKKILEDVDIEPIFKKEIFKLFYFNENKIVKEKDFFYKRLRLKEILTSLNKSVYIDVFKGNILEGINNFEKESLIKNIDELFHLLNDEIKEIIISNNIFDDCSFKQKYIIKKELSEEINNSYNKQKKKI